MIVNPGTTANGSSAPEKHAAQHAAGGTDPITPSSIGAAAENHTHTAADVGARPDDWMPTASDVGAATLEQVKSAIQESGGGGAPVSHAAQHAAGGTDPVTPASIGAAAANHTHTPASIGAAAAGHTHTASDVGALPASGGTLTGDLRIKGDGNFGTKINLGDGDYVHIAEPTDDCLEIKAKKINFVTTDTTDTRFTLNGEKIGGGASVEPGTVTPKAAGTGAVGSSAKYAREDHVHPSQTSVSGNAGSASKLSVARTIDGVSFNGSAAITHYGTCSTAAATRAKTVSCTGFSLVTGARIAVKFTYANTNAAPSLNVNSTGEKNIAKYGTAAAGNGAWAAGEVVEFVYDGTRFVMVDGAAREKAQSAGSAGGLKIEKVHAQESSGGAVSAYKAQENTLYWIVCWPNNSASKATYTLTYYHRPNITRSMTFPMGSNAEGNATCEVSGDDIYVHLFGPTGGIISYKIEIYKIS